MKKKGTSGTLQVIPVIALLALATSTVSMSAINNENQPDMNRIDEYLRKLVITGSTDVNVPVVIVFKEQPAHEISLKIKKKYKSQFDEITEPARVIYSKIKPQISGKENKNISEIMALEQTLLSPEDKAILKDVGEKLETKTREMRREILNQTAPQVDEIQNSTIERIKAKGWSIKYSSKIFNAIVVDIPASSITELSGDKTVYKIYHDYLLNESLDISVQAMGANTWWGNGYNGSTMDAAVVDTGIDGSHPGLSVDYAEVFHASGRHHYLYADRWMDPDDLQGHGTHVAGIVASGDTIYRGAGYGIDKLINAKAGWKGTDGGGYMYWSDAMQAMDWAIYGNADDADVISLSFGGGATNGDSGFEHFLDAIVQDLDIPIAVANGNEGPGSGTVGEPAGAFNILAVGNVNDKNTISRADDSLTSSSSRGTTIDGRIKPDISAPGTSILSANNNWETQADFVSKTGTSMATPQITGSILLILNYRNMRWKPEAIKALLLNSAEDKGTAGPDNDYGFGYVNLSNAYIHRDDVSTGSIEDLHDGSVEKFYKLTANNGDRATLVWNRHVAYNGKNDPTSFLNLADLDLFMYNEANGAYISSSISRLNNVEQVKSNGYYVSAILKIDPHGTFPAGVTVEEYALAADELFVNVTPPVMELNLTNPENIAGGADFVLNFTINNSGGIAAHNVSVNMSLPSGFILVSGANPQSLGIISSGSSMNFSWLVRAPNAGLLTQYSLNATASSNSYGELYSDTGNNTIIVMADSSPPDSVTDLMNVSYAENYINWTWADPQNQDFAKVMIYMDGIFRNNVSRGLQYYNDTNLAGGAIYSISTRTVDSSGNINATTVMHNASTKLPLIRFINGTVRDNATGVNISGVRIFANSSSYTTSNILGFYSLTVSAGVYDLTAEHEPDYYANSTIIVTTELSSFVLQDIDLFKKPTGTISGSVANI